MKLKETCDVVFSNPHRQCGRPTSDPCGYCRHMWYAKGQTPPWHEVKNTA